MKIWVIGREFPTEENHQRGSFELDQAKMLAGEFQTFYPAVDIHSVRHWRKWGLVKNKEGKLEIWNYNFPVGRLPKKFQRKIYWKLFAALLKKMEKEGLPDVIHVHYPAMTDYRIIEPYVSKGVRIVSTEHWTKVLKKKLTKEELDSLNWFSRYSTMICVGEKLRDSVQELTGTDKKISVIPNIYAPYFQRKKGKPDEKKEFCFVAAGRLEKEKQFDLLIEAFSEAFRDCPQVVLRIAGAGKEYPVLKNMVMEMKMGEQIFLMGNKTNREVAWLMQNSAVLVCSSNIETFGVPVIEAMACGIPFIATENLGFRVGLSEKCGRIVHGDRESLAEAMQEIYHNYDSYDSEYIVRTAEKYFSSHAVMHQLKEVYCGKTDLVSCSDVEF